MKAVSSIFSVINSIGLEALLAYSPRMAPASVRNWASLYERFRKRSASRSMIVGNALAGPNWWYTVMSSVVKALVSSPRPTTVLLYLSPGTVGVPRNIMCSKKCA